MNDHLDTLAGSELAVSPPAEIDRIVSCAPPAPSIPPKTVPKSPPLAFERTPNDALAPFITSSPGLAALSASSLSPLPSGMGGLGSPAGNEARLQSVVQRQSVAIDKLHDAFAAERLAWHSERDGLYQRIAALEQLLKTRDHHSPAKSPTASPSLTSPNSRPVTNTKRLPSIAEDENIHPLSHRRIGAPKNIDLGGLRSRLAESSVSFSGTEDQLYVDEVPISPPTTAKLSPVPANNLSMAGHTPLRTTRVPTPPPQNMLLDGVEDTPTRHNTHINALLTQSHDDDEDPALKGPLNMPELPNQPDETNFTLDALSKRLEEVASSANERRPTVFKAPTPGVASPASEGPSMPSAMFSHAMGRSHSDRGSSVKSPNALSPDGAPLSQQLSQEMEIHSQFEQGGIRLKKKPSFNFGQPLGQLSGFAPRKLS